MNQSIQEWRSAMRQSGHIGPEELAELESHLMDEIEKLDTTLLSEQEKVIVAGNRLGSAATLNRAFGKRRIFNFQRISVFAQVLLGIISFLTIARTSLFVSLSIQNSLGWTDSLSLVIMYYSIQLISAVVFFLLVRHWLKMSIQHGNTFRASIYALASALVTYGLFLLVLRFSDLSLLIQAPFFLSAFSISISLLFIVGFSIATVRMWFRRRKQLAVA